VARGKLPRDEWWRKAVYLSHRLQLSYFLIRVLGFFACVLPVRVSYAIVTGIAFAVYAGWHELRKSVTDNMRCVLGCDVDKKTLRQITWRSVLGYFKYLVEFLRFAGMSREDVQALIDSSGWEHLDRALAEGKGVIFCSFHLGNWDLGGAMVALRGYPMNVVVESFEPERLNRLIQHYRVEKGMKLIPLEQASRGVLRALRKGEILALLVDRPVGEEGIAVNFFGGTIKVPAGAATLARKTGARLVPGYLVRRPDNRFQGLIAPPIEPEITDDVEHDVYVMTQRLIDTLEGWIKQYPDQWYPFRRMWVEWPAGVQASRRPSIAHAGGW